MPITRHSNRRIALLWVYDQMHLALWATGLALLIVFAIELPAIYRSAESAQLERAAELRALYERHCKALGFKEISPDFHRCLGQLAELATSIERRMTEDAEF